MSRDVRRVVMSLVMRGTAVDLELMKIGFIRRSMRGFVADRRVPDVGLNFRAAVETLKRHGLVAGA